MSDAKDVELGPDFDLGLLLRLARLLTSDNAFMTSDTVSTETLLDLANAPNCENADGPFIVLFNSMYNDPPTYQGQDPIADIMTTLQQLGSCQQNTGLALHFNKRKALRQLLLLSVTVVQCLCLWYVLQRSNLIGQPGGVQVGELQNFCRMALMAKKVSAVDPQYYPPAITDMLAKTQNWDGNMQTVLATFRVGTIYAAPILLIFRPDTLAEILTMPNGLPMQIDPEVKVTSPTEDTQIIPMVLLNQNQVNGFVSNLVKSGTVKTMP
jgi:hypothetical protein